MQQTRSRKKPHCQSDLVHKIKLRTQKMLDKAFRHRYNSLCNKAEWPATIAFRSHLRGFVRREVNTKGAYASEC